MYELFANLTLLVHFIFIVFVVLGGLLFFIFPKTIYIHLPGLLWGIYIEFTSSICPLTDLENWFLDQAGLITYDHPFINHYLFPIIYPEGLTPDIQMYIGTILIVINLGVYGLILRKIKKRN